LCEHLQNQKSPISDIFVFHHRPQTMNFFKAFYYFALLLKNRKIKNYHSLPLNQLSEIPGVKTLIQICPHMPIPRCPTFFSISAKNPPTLQTKKLHPYYITMPSS